MATATRASELHELSFSVSSRGEDLVLHYDPFFVAKTETASNPLPRSSIIPSLTEFIRDIPEWILCPVRATQFLRRAAQTASLTPSRLFASMKDRTRPMSKNATSFFLRHLISDSGAVSSTRPPRAHDIRGISTSLHFFSNLSVSRVMELATWRSNRVFAMRYLKDMSSTQLR